MTRPRIARLQQRWAGLRAVAGRPRDATPAEPDRRTAAELERRLDETRARLKREIPPKGDS